jgi:hypothetical protein
MAWTASGMFRQTFCDILDLTLASADLDLASMCKIALYDNSITPNFDVVASASAYAGGVWSATGGATGTPQVYHTGQWAQAGVVLASADVTVPAAGIVMFDANDTASGSAATMSNIYGGLIYLDGVTTPVADQGLLAVYFGGTAYSVTNGTFTIQWNASGIFRLTVA